MLFPKKTKYRRWQTGRKNENKVRLASRGITLHHGSYGLKATSRARVTSNQIESARKTVSRMMGKTGRYWIRIFPDRPITRKAAEVGMGKGKGNTDGFCVEVLSGRIMFEVGNVSEETAREALRKAGKKLPMTTRVVARGDVY